jgi:hypothetical protein
VAVDIYEVVGSDFEVLFAKPHFSPTGNSQYLHPRLAALHHSRASWVSVARLTLVLTCSAFNEMAMFNYGIPPCLWVEPSVL